MSNILLVEPRFPVASKNSREPIPIGLLKLASLHRQCGNRIQLVKGNELARFEPDEILITSLFTYWSQYVWDSVGFCKEAYPNAKITVGGIYASLMPEHCKRSGCDEVFIGVHPEAEECFPAYDLVNADYQIIHASRGCFRHCRFCGVWRIEPEISSKESILPEISSNRLVFYDNNLLANPHIERILEELANARHDGRPVYCECQCGIDGKLLTPKIAQLLKKSRFAYPRIAWDGPYSDEEQIARHIGMLVDAGYRPRNIYVFMLYNYDIDFEEMERKRLKCREWGVQVADCRYRPLDQTFDNYSPWAGQGGQTSRDYYIHPAWTDADIRQFRRNVRQQNICIRHGFASYSRELERGGRRRARS